MKGLVTSHPAGSTKLPENAFREFKTEISLTSPSLPASLPQPPFLVPAVLEILRSSPTWGPLIEVVAGEADNYCAEHVRKHGSGIVLTGDSDLLITDLGPEGKVAFFSHMVSAPQDDGVLACQFSLPDLNKTLGLKDVGGLPRVAFEIEKKPCNFAEAVERAKNSNNDDSDSLDFQKFVQEYCMTEYIPKEHTLHKVLSDLDPRVSEIVIQTLLLKGDTTSTTTTRGPENLAMFLPIMIENRDKKSAWSMSTPVRQLAYGIMQEFAPNKSTSVIEYRLLEVSNRETGRKINILGKDETLDQCHLLVETFKQLKKRIPGIDPWLVFAIFQDIAWSSCEQRSPLSVSLRETDADTHSWDTIHFTAQVQASLYSLRMTKQALDVAACLCPTLPAPMQALRECLVALPPIAEWPTVENITQKLATAKTSKTLKGITDILQIPMIKTPKPLKKTKKRKKVQQHGLDRNPKRPTSSNPFDILSSSNE